MINDPVALFISKSLSLLHSDFNWVCALLWRLRLSLSPASTPDGFSVEQWVTMWKIGLDHYHIIYLHILIYHDNKLECVIFAKLKIWQYLWDYLYFFLLLVPWEHHWIVNVIENITNCSYRVVFNNKITLLNVTELYCGSLFHKVYFCWDQYFGFVGLYLHWHQVTAFQFIRKED